MNIKKYFKKRTILVSALSILLMVVGYLNRQLTEDALLQSSKGYKTHEEREIGKMTSVENDESLEASSKNIQVVDSQKNKKVEKVENKTDYFIEQRISRDKNRGETVDRLNKIIEDNKTKEDTRDSAQNELMEISDMSEMELFLEGAIKAKGFKDAVVFLNNDNARIVIDKPDLSEQDVMKSLEIVTSETELKVQNIKIMKKQ